MRPPPLFAVALGVAGLVPFLVCGLFAIGPTGSDADRALRALMDYAAIVLAFLGAVHWGLALAAGPEQEPARRTRFGLGVVPSLIGWAALLTPLILPAWTGLGLLILGYLGTALIETRATASGWLPRGYLIMRWVLTAVVAAVLTTVMTLRVIGIAVAT